jgi:hypothetical protein
MSDHCGYPRQSVLPPFFLNGDDPTSALLRERAFLLGLPGSGPPPPPPPPPAQFMRGAPMMWRPHPTGIPNIDPNEVYNLIAASAACPPWYSAAALASASTGFRGTPSMPPTTAAALALASSPHLWSVANAAAAQAAQLPLGLTSRTPMIQNSPSVVGSGPMIRSPTDVNMHSIHRYPAFFYSSPKKEVSSNSSINSDSDSSATPGMNISEINR